jgi:hypothetical protein
MRMAGWCLIVCLLFSTGCALTSKASNYNRLASVDGTNPTHLNTTKYALHALVKWPLIGDASLDRTVEEFTEEARAVGANRVRIVQSSETRLWWILPPITFLITPAWTNVAGEALP